MLLANFQVLEKILIFFFTINGHGCHFGHVTLITHTNVCSLHKGQLHIKLGIGPT